MPATARSAPRAQPGIRLTVHPGEDVLVRPGTRLGDARAGLAALMSRPELLNAPLTVAGTAVDDDQVCGSRPLLPGAVLRFETGTAPAPAVMATGSSDEAALRAPWHVAATTGPTAGRLWALTPGSRVRVDDLEVRTGARRLSRGAPDTRIRVRGPRPARLLPRQGGRRPRRIGPRRLRGWREGRSVQRGETTYELRRRPRLEDWTFDSAPATAESAATGGTSLGTTLTMGIAPAVGSFALAATMRQPLFALFALVGPLAMLVPHLLETRRRRAAERAGLTPASGTLPASQRGAPPAEQVPLPGGPPLPRPADLVTRAVAAHLAPDLNPRADPAERTLAVPAGADARWDGPDLPDGCVAVVGDRERALSAARALVAHLVGGGARVTVLHADERRTDWAWCRWLPGARRGHGGELDDRRHDPREGHGTEGSELRVLVVDGARLGRWSASLGQWWAARTPADRVVLIEAERSATPAWCRTVLDVGGATAGGPAVGETRWTLPDGSVTAGPLVGVTDGWAARFARRIAAAEQLGRWPAGRRATVGGESADPADPNLPERASLVALLGAQGASSPSVAPPTPAILPDAAQVTARWAEPGTGLPLPLGVGVGGATVEVDLVRDGPHVLVAGTTGSGKSEMLQSLVLSLALSRSPRDLSIALVDYKGGASFGECARLPHVVGQVTDLEPGLAGRALAGLRAELRRREHLLSAAQVTRIEDLDAGALPRLLIVIDEFRAMADDLPDFLPGLLRIAAQGRSLGIHLVLATQRPAGAVSADMRANLALRIALRLVDPADSQDVIEAPHAARIPSAIPGRAVVRRGSAPPVALQCAHAGSLPDSATAAVRRAPSWGGPSWGGGPWGGPSRAPDGSGGSGAETSGPDTVALLVEAARAAAREAGLEPAPPPWLPGLPRNISREELHAHPPLVEAGRPGSPTDPLGLTFALADIPEAQRRAAVTWAPTSGALAVVGRARSGSSTVLRTLAAAALHQGWHVHAIASDRDLGDLAAHPGFGTLVDGHDPRRVARLLHLLTRTDPTDDARRVRGPGTLVVVDGVEDLRQSMARLAGGAGADVLGVAMTEGPACGVHFVVTANTPGLAGLTPRIGPRLVLSSTDKHDDVALGIPGALAGLGGQPGRAVWLGEGGPVSCQAAQVAIDGSADSPQAPAPVPAPLRLVALPHLVTSGDVTSADLTATDIEARTDGAGTDEAGSGRVDAMSVPIGLGGDEARPVYLDLADGVLVVGPSGSGRSTTLLQVARHALAAGLLRAVIARDGLLARLDAPVTATAYVPAAVSVVLDQLRGLPHHRPHVVVIDDLDLLVQACPLEADALSALLRDGLVVVASSTTGNAAVAYRGPVAELRSRRRGVVLAPSTRGSDDVYGRGLGWVSDGGTSHPGRAVVVRGAHLEPVQLVQAR